MKQLRYANATNAFHFDFPSEWDPELLTALVLQIKDLEGTELLADTTVTLFTATTLDGDVNAYASSIVLDSGTDTPEIGDVLLMKGVEGDSVVKVKAWSATDFTAELEAILDYDYADGEAVYGMFGNINIDLSNTTTFPLGEIIQLLWKPTGTGQEVTTLAQVSKSALDVEGLRKTFSYVFPRAYKGLTDPTDRVSVIFDQAEHELGLEMLAENMDIQRIKDQDVISPALMTKAALIWLNDGDENKEDERKYLMNVYATQVGILKKLPIWTDTDQDDVQDDHEVSDHEPIFDRRW